MVSVGDDFVLTSNQQFDIPQAAEKIRIVAIGGGGGGGGNDGNSGPGASGGGGGGLAWVDDVDATSLSTLDVNVGNGGNAGGQNSNGDSGGDSSVFTTSGTEIIRGRGGGGGESNVSSGNEGFGGGFDTNNSFGTSRGGGSGGDGGPGKDNSAGAGGGGAGGYTGSGGDGDSGNGSGGGAGAGADVNSQAANEFSGGAGTGFNFKGTSGNGGSTSNKAEPGSGGGFATTNRGGEFGGGGGGTEDDTPASGTDGGSGAVYVEVTAVESNPPTAPSNLSASNLTSSSVDLSWTGSTDNESGVDFYKVFENGTSIKQVPAATTTTTISGKSKGTTNTYEVSAVDNAGNESTKSNSLNVTFLPSLGANKVVGAAEPTTAVTRFIFGNWRGFFDGRITERTQVKVEGGHAQKWKVDASKTTADKAVYRADQTLDPNMSTAFGTTSGGFAQGTIGWHIRIDDTALLRSTDALQLKVGSSSSDYAVWTLDRSELRPNGEYNYLTFSHDEYDSIVGTPDWTNVDFFELTMFETSGNTTDTFIYVDYLTVSDRDDVGATGVGDRRSDKQQIRSGD